MHFSSNSKNIFQTISSIDEVVKALYGKPSKTMVSKNYFTFAIFIPSNSTLFFIALGNCIGE